MSALVCGDVKLFLPALARFAGGAARVGVWRTRLGVVPKLDLFENVKVPAVAELVTCFFI